MNKDDVTFVIFGATGDLTKRKLIPGIYNLINHNGIKNFHILGVARRPFSGKKLINSSKKFIKNPKPNLISKLKKNSSYLKIDFTKSDFTQLKSKLNELEKKGFTNKIFYFATGSNNFQSIADKLEESGSLKNKSGWTRAVFEKPFGSNRKTSDKLNKCLKQIFTENQIYRIDHYLGKELVGNISIIRFTNRMLNPLWCKDHIENIQIILDENIGIEERGPFYDTYGAIKDMVQNHMLQLLALTTMEMPTSLIGEPIRNKKAQILKKFTVKDTIVGQYSGYLNEKGIKKESKTETFAALKLEINHKNWKGVPIFFKTGKFLNRKESKIVINFKESICLFEKLCPPSNFLEIRIFPNEGIGFNINVKQPGKIKTSQIKIDFCHSCVFGPNTPEGYENLFTDIIKGDQTAFTREDEVQNAWNIIDKIKRGKVYKYKKGSTGPKELKAFNKKHKIKWH